MPRRRSLPFGVVVDDVTFTEGQIRALENQYGHALGPRALVLLSLATSQFAMQVQIESSSPNRATIAKIKRLQKLVASLRKDFPRGDEDGPFRIGHARHNYKLYRGAWKIIAPAFWLEWFAETLEDNEQFLQIVLQHLTADAFIRSGESWNLWVFSLSQILKDADLPVTTRRDGLAESSFARLVRELQNQMPTRIRALVRTGQAEALATAIRRALKQFAELADIPSEVLIKMICGALVPMMNGDGDGDGDVTSFVADPKKLKQIDDLLGLANRSN